MLHVLLTLATGQGVHTAMLSGIKASQAILDSSNNNQHNFTLYEEWFHSYFEAKMPRACSLLQTTWFVRNLLST